MRKVKRPTTRNATGLLVLMVGLLQPLAGSAQDDPCEPPTDKKVVKLLADAEKARTAPEHHQKLKEALEEDPDRAEILFKLGVSAYRQLRDSPRASFAPALKYFDKLEETCPGHHIDVYYYTGLMHYSQGEYAEAAKAFQAFQRFPSDDPSKLGKDVDKKSADVEEVMPELAFYTEFYRNELPFDPQVLRGVSTPSDEYLPMFSPDNSILFFTRVGKYQAKGDLVAKDVEELTESRRASLEVDFDRGQALPEPFNQGDSYGGVTISVNNKELFVTVCKPVGEGYRNCDIFRTHYDNHMDFGSGMEVWEWTGLEDLGPAINTPDGWESQPSLSADGRTLYFATVREGSRGTDIYSSTRDDKGVWSTAKPLPAPINTDGDDKAP
ncbi:MAG TPA: tetratricopeptide repeat protein, partial [Flavobacteriales bacterium]|nr:tetratricopeptide repeat protein [Flavobacteriales bacterium]